MGGPRVSNDAIGHALLLSSKGLQGKAIAEELGISTTTVSRILTGKLLANFTEAIPQDEIVEMHDEGLTNLRIEEILGIERHKVAAVLSIHGRRSRPGARGGIMMVDEVNAECTKCGLVIPRAILPWGRVTKNPYQLSYCRTCLTRQSVDNTKKSIPQYLKHRHRSIKTRCKKAGTPFDLPGGHLLSLYERQKGLCFYTDERMKVYFGTSKSGSRRDSLSVDRIIPHKGYIPGNVVLCIARVNTVKNDCTIQEVQEWLPGWYAKIVKLWERAGIETVTAPGWDDQFTGLALPQKLSSPELLEES